MEYGRPIHTRLATVDRGRFRDCDEMDFFAILSTDRAGITWDIIASPDAFARNQRPGENNASRQPGNDDANASRSDAVLGEAPAIPPIGIPPVNIPKEGSPPKWEI